MPHRRVVSILLTLHQRTHIHFAADPEVPGPQGLAQGLFIALATTVQAPGVPGPAAGPLARRRYRVGKTGILLTLHLTRTLEADFSRHGRLWKVPRIRAESLKAGDQSEPGFKKSLQYQFKDLVA